MTPDETVKNYIRRATVIMQFQKDGKIIEDISKEEIPPKLARFALPMIIEMAKMIQLEELRNLEARTK